MKYLPMIQPVPANVGLPASRPRGVYFIPRKGDVLNKIVYFTFQTTNLDSSYHTDADLTAEQLTYR